LHGFLNINKPQGYTSYDVIRKLKKVFPPKTKLGHLGTLDPMAAGVLPLAIGKATRLIEYLDDTKEYLAEMKLGASSDTQDAWGDISYSGNVNFSMNELRKILDSFRGIIKQLPPMYSAVHHEGKRLYELARQGVSVERQEREVEITLLDLLDVDLSHELPRLQIKVICSRGTYIRTLCNDIGERLGTGAFMSALLRTRTGEFALNDAVSIDELQGNRNNIEKFLLPVDYPLGHLPKIMLKSKEETIAVLNGNRIVYDSIIPPGKARIYSPERELIAIAGIQFNGEKALIKPLKVFN
jgi:tRNA pseudouridine55 synthase